MLWGLGAVVLVYWAAMALGQRALLYPAPTGPWSTAVPPDAERVALATPSGAMPAWWLRPTGGGTPAPALVFLHGNGERAEPWLDRFGELRAAGVGVLVPEYPGYGIAPGAPSEAALVATAIAAVDWLATRPEVDPSRVVLHGRSLGGGVAAQVVPARRLAALVLESTFRSVTRLARERLVPPVFVRDRYESEAALRDARVPTLVLHGLDDPLIPVAHGRALAAAIPGATFVGVRCGHDDCPDPTVTMLAFLRRTGVLRNLPAGHVH